MLRRTVFLNGLVVAMTATAVLAQDRPRRQFGFGGPGGMFGNSAMLLGMPEVQKELGVTDEQKGLIEDMVADLREQMRAGGAGFQDFQNLSQEERQKRFEEARKRGEEINKKTEDMVNMILEPKQVERLEQLRLQQQGVRSFERDDVAKKLELTQEQRDKISKIQEEARPAFRDFRDMSEEERREFFTKMREQAEKANAAVLAVLTDAQRETWTKMQGKKFEFPQPSFGGQRRRQGGN